MEKSSPIRMTLVVAPIVTIAAVATIEEEDEEDEEEKDEEIEEDKDEEAYNRIDCGHDDGTTGGGGESVLIFCDGCCDESAHQTSQ